MPKLLVTICYHSLRSQKILLNISNLCKNDSSCLVGKNNRIKVVVLNRVCILEIFCLKQGQDLQPLAAKLCPNTLPQLQALALLSTPPPLIPRAPLLRPPSTDWPLWVVRPGRAGPRSSSSPSQDARRVRSSSGYCKVRE